MGISPKENVIAWLGFELDYYDVAVQPVSLYAIELLPDLYKFNKCYDRLLKVYK